MASDGRFWKVSISQSLQGSLARDSQRPLIYAVALGGSSFNLPPLTVPDSDRVHIGRGFPWWLAFLFQPKWFIRCRRTSMRSPWFE
ncbi:hypothetical protein MPLDJ20_80235 [Mesorhizobium plurifarium]|uniref:Uncharacterized protein n=1 Tax=Mesorhizobium plurifarium TaxID=69974 RepID=A0A090FQ96_MESPL|nr:hypothetical protein MPLDJ20_80235 [Mesorhizobium plurifarium]